MYTFILYTFFSGFRTLRIAIKANWNNYYNISNVPTSLYLSQMKRDSGSHYFLDLFTNPTNCYLLLRCTHLREWKLVFCSVLRRVYVRRIYSLITKYFKFDWSIQVAWEQRAYSLVQQHESWQIFQLLSFLIPVGAGGLLKQIIVLFWVIIYSYLQKVFKKGVLKNLSEFTGKHLCRSLFLIIQ